jgi:hypothetical protein
MVVCMGMGRIGKSRRLWWVGHMARKKGKKTCIHSFGGETCRKMVDYKILMEQRA